MKRDVEGDFKCCPLCVRFVLVVNVPTSKKYVNAVQRHLSSMTGCIWASWPCCHLYCTGSLSSGTQERKGADSHFDIQVICPSLLSSLTLCFFPPVLSSSALLQHITAMLECSVSAVVTLLVTEPVGMFSIRSCRVQMLSDWYTMLYNPSPDYVNTLHCTQEAVYPL